MIEVQHLCKRYGNHDAVHDLNFQIEDGKIYGFLGPNGAGKSTTMNILTGCLAATSGTVTINGYDIFEDAEEAKRQIGYLPEIPPLYMDMTPREYLSFVGKAKGLRKAELMQQLDHVMQVTEITTKAEKLIKTLSKGYRQRVGIAQALLGNPQVIILDEPTVGLDPHQIVEIRDLIRALGKEHTVILSSHILSEVQAVCDKVLIISKGELVANDTPQALEKLFEGSNRIELTVRATESEVKDALLDLVDDISELQYIPSDSDDGLAQVVLNSGGKDISEQIFFGFCRVGRPILRMNVTKLSLEDIFMELTGANEEPDFQTVLGDTDAAEVRETAADIADAVAEAESEKQTEGAEK